MHPAREKVSQTYTFPKGILMIPLPGAKMCFGPYKPQNLANFVIFMEIYPISMKLAKSHLFGRQNCISTPRPPKPQYSLWNINGSGHDFSPKNAISPKIGNLP